jgi:hypothetical protein
MVSGTGVMASPGKTLRRWWRRYQAKGIVGLEERSRRPHRSASRKIFAEQEASIPELRRARQLGIKQLRNETPRVRIAAVAGHPSSDAGQIWPASPQAPTIGA